MKSWHDSAGPATAASSPQLLPNPGSVGAGSSLTASRIRPLSRASTVLAVLWLALGVALEAAPPKTGRKTDPAERGPALAKTEPRRLPSETNSPMLAPLAASWNQLVPERMRFPTVRSNHTVHIAVHCVGRNPDAPVLVFIHGILADHLTWKYVAAEFAGDHELWLVDLPGCGDSDAPAASAIERDGYSPTAMGDRLWQALSQCMEVGGSSAPRRLTLVGHSLGTMVTIRMMSAPDLRTRYAGMIQSAERVVLMAPCDLAVNSVPSSFKTLLGLSGFKVGVGRFLGVFKPAVRDLVRRGYQVPECATRERELLVFHALADRRHREAAKAMLRQAVPFNMKQGRPRWRDVDQLVADYAGIQVPVLIVHGEWDETLYSGMGNKLKDEVPGSLLVKVPQRGHALPTEDPVACADLIRRFESRGTVAELIPLLSGHGHVYTNGAPPGLLARGWPTKR
jgi:pimeloyl-ACP methyl ester carboxylesterase